MSINIAIIGFGNLGKACAQQIHARSNEFNLVGIFSRRQSKQTIPLECIHDYSDKIDVALFCGGSSEDAPKLVPYLNGMGLSTVDSYDNHDNIKNQTYQNAIRAASVVSGYTTVAIVGAGWDPGYLSLQRILNKAIMPEAVHNTFYGGENGGLSMGHTNAIKGIAGVEDAHQITLPRKEAVERATGGATIDKNARHKRLCYVVAEQDKQTSIEKQIRGMEGYFKGQEVEVNFICQDEFANRFEGKHGHGGQIISVDKNAKINAHLEMQSNPLFTANCMIAYAKANYKMQARKEIGVFTIDQVPLAYLLDDAARLCEI